MSRKIIRKNLLSKQLLRRVKVLTDTKEHHMAETYDGLDLDHRHTKNWNKHLSSHLIVSIAKEMEAEFDGKHKLNQIDVLGYGKGMYFKKHQDTSGHSIGHTGIGREWSSSTLVYQSDDLEGGDLILYGPFNPDMQSGHTARVIKLKRGETVFFPSHWWHEVTPVTKGERIVIVSWLGMTPEEMNEKQKITSEMRDGRVSVL